MRFIFCHKSYVILQILKILFMFMAFVCEFHFIYREGCKCLSKQKKTRILRFRVFILIPRFQISLTDQMDQQNGILFQNKIFASNPGFTIQCGYNISSTLFFHKVCTKLEQHENVKNHETTRIIAQSISKNMMYNNGNILQKPV